MSRLLRALRIRPATAAAVVVAVYFLLGPNPNAPLQRGYHLAIQCLQLNRQLHDIHAENQQLAQYVTVAPTPEGRELFARGRYNLVRKGEWLAVIGEKPAPPTPNPTGFRAVWANVCETVECDVAALRALKKLMSRTRSSR
jgi:hypothetical protein